MRGKNAQLVDPPALGTTPKLQLKTLPLVMFSLTEVGKYYILRKNYPYFSLNGDLVLAPTAPLELAL